MADLSGMSDADLLQLAQQQLASAPPAPTPGAWPVFMNAVKQGIGGTIDQVLNTPNRVLNLGKAAVGTVADAAGYPDLAPSIRPDPNFVQTALNATGITHPDMAPQTTGERIASAAGQGMGGMLTMPANSVSGMLTNALMGAGSGAAGQATTETTGSPALGTAVSMAVPAVAAGAANIGANSVANAQAEASANAQRDATLAAGRNAGLVVVPSKITPSVTSRLLESLGGKAAIGQQASSTNQGVVNQLSAQELGLPPDTAITEGVLNNYRNQVAQPYRDVAALPQPAPQQTGTFFGEQDTPMLAKPPQSPDDALESLKQARADANSYWNQYKGTALTPGDPGARAKALAADNQVQGIETYLQDVANQNGRPDLIDAMNSARTQIAKSYNIQNALNIGNGDISAPVLGKALDRGAPLTGNLQTIGAFQQAFPSAMKESAGVPTPGVSKTGMLASAILASEGYRTLGPWGASAGLIPLASGTARKILMSAPYQNAVANPSYGSLVGKGLSLISPQTAQQTLMRALMAPQSQGAQ